MLLNISMTLKTIFMLKVAHSLPNWNISGGKVAHINKLEPI